MKIVKKVGNFIIFGILIILLVQVMYSKWIRKDCVVKIGPYAILIVLTESMEPTIQQGEMILIQEKQTYELEDIVTYLNTDGMLITHRILQMDENNFIAKGDKNQVEDESLSCKAIQGKVIYHSGGIGKLLLQNGKRGILVCLLIGGFMVSQILRKGKNYETETEKT